MKSADTVRPVATLHGELLEAARRVARVAAGHSLAADRDRRGDTPGATRAAVLDLCNGTLRRYGRVQAIVNAVSHRRGADPLVEALLWCSLYALESGRYAEYAVVDQAVRACEAARKAGAKGYVNAALRAFLRGRRNIESSLLARPEAKYQHPSWWIEKLRAAYPESWEQTLQAGNVHPPMCLRVNERRVSVTDYASKLARAGIAARRIGSRALLLERPVPVERVPEFHSGEVSVQDAGAQRAAELLELADGQRVLDACAAPGNKTAHLLESAAVELTALDADAERLERVTRNLARLGLAARVVHADCTSRQWWDGTAYERILADVPCSASGVVRRRPDVKWLRRASDVAEFARRQGEILDALWRVLAPGGKLLYATCSVFPEENEAVVAAFCARTSGAQRQALADGGPAQWLPGPEHDGFFYALLAKRS